MELGWKIIARLVMFAVGFVCGAAVIRTADESVGIIGAVICGFVAGLLATFFADWFIIRNPAEPPQKKQKPPPLPPTI